MKTKNLPRFILLAFTLFTINILWAQPEAPATRAWTGQGDGHSWTDGNNWSSVLCYDIASGIYTYVFTTPANGEIVEFINTGNITITNCPYIVLGNTDYYPGGYNHCSGSGSSSAVSLYSMQIEPFSYVTLDNIIIAGGIVAQSVGTNINTALEIDQGRLTCPGLAGNFAADGSSTPLNMNSIKATNSIIEITNPGTGGLFSPSGRTYFDNCTITCTFFGPSSNGNYPTEKDEFYGCTINTKSVGFFESTISEIHASTFNMSGNNFGLNTYTNVNSVLLDSVQINVSSSTPSFVITYKTGANSLKGNVTCFNIDSSFQLSFSNGENVSTPFNIDGNVITNGGSIFIGNKGTLNLTGNLELDGRADPNLLKDVVINGKKTFEIGGSTNYVNYNVSIYGPIPGSFPFGIKFSGSSDSHIRWPTGFPVDTLTIEKSGCAKVYFDSVPLHVTGKLQVNSGQLVLSSHPVSNYTLVDGGDLIIRDGGSVLLEGNSDVALAGNFIDSNSTVGPSICHGFTNNANNTVSFYNTIYTPANRVVGSVSNTSVGNVKFINQDKESYSLQNNFVTDDFDLGNNGKVILGDNNFTVNGTLTNFNNSNYFITNGKGDLILPDSNNLSVFFPVGISETSYTPVTVTNNGVKDSYKVRVQEGLYNNGENGTLITEKAVDRTWYVEEGTVGGSNADITLQWNAENELNNFDRNNAYLIHYTNNNWDFGTSMSAVGNNPYQITRNNITSFSPFAVSNQNAVLPLTLLDFIVINKTNLIQLNWKTSNEINALGFDIERSEDGVHFSKLSFVSTTGNSVTVNSYTYNDLHPLQLKNYYRLKLIDQDGKFDYSKIEFVQFNSGKYEVTIFPNPVHNILNIQLANNESSKITYRVINTSGKILKKTSLVTNSGTQVIPINIGFLSKGFYYLVVTNGTAINNFKFIKD